MKSPIVTRIIWFCIIAIILYTFWILWNDARSKLEVFKAFPWIELPLILFLVLINFVLRELKWDYFRQLAGIRVPRLGSFLVFFSGYSMAISPGRVGELIKPFMYKEYFGEKMEKSIPLVFCERITDLMGMVVLAILTIPFYLSGSSLADSPNLKTAVVGFLIISIISLIGGVAIVRNKSMVYMLLAKLRKIGKLRNASRKLYHIYRSTYPLLKVKSLLTATSMASISWFFECVAMDLILKGVGAESVTIFQVTFVFCMATIFGGFLFFLPGGLGGFEGASQTMLTALGVAKIAIAPAILITRFSTLFFAVAIGFIFIIITSAKYHKSLNWKEFQESSGD